MDNSTQVGAPAGTEEKKNKLQAVDLATLGNSGGLYSEKVIVDGTADAFAFSNPVDDSWYVAKLVAPDDPSTPLVQFREAGVSAKGEKYGKSLIINFRQVIEAYMDPQADNSKLVGKAKSFDANVSTFITQRDGKPTSEAVTLLTYLGANIPPNTTLDIEMIALNLAKAIQAGTAKVAIRTQWKAGWTPGVKGQSRGKWSLSGQANFPLAKGGQIGIGPYSSTISVNGEEFHATAKVVEMKPLPRS